MPTPKKPTVNSLLAIKRVGSYEMIDVNTGCLRISQQEAIALIETVDDVNNVAVLSDTLVRVSYSGNFGSCKRHTVDKLQAFVKLPDDPDYTPAV